MHIFYFEQFDLLASEMKNVPKSAKFGTSYQNFLYLCMLYVATCGVALDEL